MIIYKVINKINNKFYIGQTVSALEKRISEHKFVANKGRDLFFKDYSLLHKALNKYRFENFDWEILMHCTSKSMLDAAEIFFIDRYNTKVPNGYNLTDGGGGNSGCIVSKETREKKSESMKGKNKGKHSPLSEEVKNKISE